MQLFHRAKFPVSKQASWVILTGAGVSADSGVATFRDSGGLWEGHSVEEVATPEGFQRNPKLVTEFYNRRRIQLNQVEPNPAHRAIADFQKVLGKRCFLVTQNVDDLHERGGSTQVCHMHGELRKLRCLDCDHVFGFFESQTKNTLCPKCQGSCRPHIVWFGEMPFDLSAIQNQVENCTHFLYIGTSNQVYPAAGYRSLAYQQGAEVIGINLDIEEDVYTHWFLEGRRPRRPHFFCKLSLKN